MKYTRLFAAGILILTFICFNSLQKTLLLKLENKQLTTTVMSPRFIDAAKSEEEASRSVGEIRIEVKIAFSKIQTLVYKLLINRNWQIQ